MNLDDKCIGEDREKFDECVEKYRSVANQFF